MKERSKESSIHAEFTEDKTTEAVKTVPTPMRIPLTHRTAAKVTAFILFILMAFLAVGSVLAAFVMIDENIYTTPEQVFRYNVFEGLTQSDAYTLIGYLKYDDTSAEQIAANYLSGRNIASVKMHFFDRDRQWVYDGGTTADNTVYQSIWYHMVDWNTGESWYSPVNDTFNAEELDTVEVNICLSNELTKSDEYYLADHLISVAYALRYWVYGIGLAAVILVVACFVFLLCASGRRAGYTDPQPGWGTWVPADLLTAAVGLGGAALLSLTIDAVWFHSAWKTAVVYCLVCIVLASMLLGWSMSMALRVKLGGWWKKTFLYRIIHLLLVFLRKAAKGVGRLLQNIPLVWKTALFLAVLACLEFLVISNGEMDIMIFFWAIKHLLLIPLVLFIALMLRKLQKGGEALAAGDLSYQVNTKRLVFDFKQHGENLNRIGEGMTAAVEQRLRSERMKTELITNVSHDIKTPLTSIINYSDLIEKETCENEKITEYAGVLHRQSERLKRLIEDLVEASKASTGNLEVLLAPCEVGVMLTQTAGEYEQRLAQSQLELVTIQPDVPVTILADGRRLWRVFENLMNNICKYAQPGTRVYLTLEKTGDKATISFKNTSREALNLPADELLERFVQGDRARKTDGNGLGLSIAKSLTELQNGTLHLTVDGDFFKVVLTFPVLR